MADTLRSLDEIQTLFANNSQGLITPQKLRDFVASTHLTSFKKVLPVDSSFSWVNQGAASISTNPDGSLVLRNETNNSNSYIANLRVKSAPSAPCTLTVSCMPIMHPSQYSMSGLALRESSSGKLLTFGFRNDSSAFNVGWGVYWTDATTYYGGGTEATPMPWLLCAPTGILMRINDDNTNINFALSQDGVNWMTVHSVLRTDFWDTMYDQLGFYVNPYNQDSGIIINSWSET